MHLHLGLLKSGIVYDCVLQNLEQKLVPRSGLLAVPGFQFLSPAGMAMATNAMGIIEGHFWDI